MKLPKGFWLNGLNCGIRPKKKKRDLAVFYSFQPANAVGVFTQNYAKAAPVILSQKRVPSNTAQAIVVNSGCANAGTGSQGLNDAQYLTKVAARKLGLETTSVLMASTGVIGEYLPVEKMELGINRLLDNFFPLDSDPAAAVEAIMTTDTFPKISFRQFNLAGKKITIWGCAKGAGMINPQMATMLSFILTDAAIELKNLDRLLKGAVENSFNSLTVDGETSTNDSVMLLANGASLASPVLAKTKESQIFQAKLAEVCLELAKNIARDGEGAGKLIEVIVKNAPSPQKARILAKSVANSSLVKTAIYGNDPNWGRVISALGKAGVKFLPQKTSIYFGSICLAKNGLPQNFSEPESRKILSRKEVRITIDLHYGKNSAKIFTCDLTPKYVEINSDYRS
ncbi:MAG: bifunctional glutamate N-acetyltransferase/amino-acid acetyltransferase ArgJ [Elusimicrobiota bacterium]